MKSGMKLAAIGAALMFTAVSANAAEMKFTHVMNIGTTGTGEGQFKYVEDFAFTQGREASCHRCGPRLGAGVRQDQRQVS